MRSRAITWRRWCGAIGLYLFWVTFMDKPSQKVGSGDNKETGSQGENTIASLKLSELIHKVTKGYERTELDLQLHWSEYLQGEWSTHSRLVAATHYSNYKLEPVTVQMNFDPGSVIVYVEKITDDVVPGVHVHLTSESKLVIGGSSWRVLMPCRNDPI